MEIRNLGKAGLSVSELCLGAMTFGREANEAESHAMLDRFVAAGGNFIDTADVYSRGASEEILGHWLARQSRDDLVIATKVRFGTDDPDARRPNRFGLGRKHIMSAVEASLTRLKTDYIDLYQVHMWDPWTPLEETLSTLDTLVKSGKVRYIGASNYSGWQLQKSVDLAKANGWEPFACLQALYNLLDRDAELELLHVVRNEGLGMIPWSPLRGGWLAGRYHRGLNAPVSGTRIELASSQGWSESLGTLQYRPDVDGDRYGPRDRQGPRQEPGAGGAELAVCGGRASPGRSSAPATWRSSRTISALPAGSSSEGEMQRLTAASEPAQLPYPYEAHRARLGI